MKRERGSAELYGGARSCYAHPVECWREASARRIVVLLRMDGSRYAARTRQGDMMDKLSAIGILHRQ